MAPWMQPLTGGIPAAEHSFSACLNEVRSDTSQRGVATRTPRSSRSRSSSFAESLVAPLRERRMRFFAPRLAIHRAILRPTGYGPSPQAGFFHDYGCNLTTWPPKAGS
ncbi:hypothetical protein KXV57_005700 [Aspergillus fumigatus]|uniref:Uncharacterized protein n=1 Tax=Aspergillus fumigatus TaxID=746128 RepID=A0A9P8NPT3_ASPFM|nr:hypothetical protein KXV57_005700 [Aspergillus fumigatus]